MTPPLPGFFDHLFLLWRMRLSAAANGSGGRGKSALRPALVHLPALLPGLLLAVGAHALMVHPAVAGSEDVSRFFLGLLCFVAALVWAAWPVLSAGVDDHSEVSRYVAFPISRPRLLVASTLAGLLEPIAFIVYAPVVGAAIGYARVAGLSWPLLAVPLFLAFVLMCATWSRVGLHLVLGVLRSKRSAEAIGGFLGLMLVAGILLPPVDTSWMYGEGGGFGAIETDVLANAALAFARVPPGYLAEGLRHLAEGRPALVLLELGGLLFFALLGLLVADTILARAWRGAGRAPPVPPARHGFEPFAAPKGMFSVLVRREVLDLWRNPRARLLAGVPFILAVLLRLLSGRDLFAHLLGPVADAWLMAGLALYGAILVLSTFAQNAFAYDGHGLRLVMSAPVPPALILQAKNLVHGLSATALGVVLCLFHRLYLGGGDVFGLLVALFCVATVVPVGLSAGNFLSLVFPVKFHASLQRRDKPPLASAILGLGAAGIGAASLPAAMRVALVDGPGVRSVMVALCCAGAAWAVYAFSLPRALAVFHRRREAVLAAVTRS
jgi:ABC-2 type transport system permease protein